MPTDIIDYEIVGDDLHAFIVTLDPQEAVVAEAGAMMYMEDDIEMATSLSIPDDGSGLMGKLFQARKRLVTGESFFTTSFAREGTPRRVVAFAAPCPGQVSPLQLAEHGGEIICQKDSFHCGARGIGAAPDR